MIRLALALLFVPLAACSARSDVAAALAPRSAEAIDPRAPLPAPPPPGPASAVVASEIRRLNALGRSQLSAFEAAADRASGAAASAGPRQSESWIAAQQLLSAAVTLREPLTVALADLDALEAREISRGSLTPGDRLAIEAAARALGAIDESQAARIGAVAARLGS